MGNTSLTEAKDIKYDEFYTQYGDIEREMTAYLEYDPNVFRDKTILLPCDDPEWSNFTKYFAQNFETFGLKKLISTSYAIESKNYDMPYQLTLFETESPHFDIDKTRIKGKIFTLTKDTNKNGRIDIDDLEWSYLEGDGDFRSQEVMRLRDEADIIITNPPFSLWRDFIRWIIEAKKKFVIIGNLNAITYVDIFPYIRDNKMWLGKGFQSGNAYFSTKVLREYADGVFNVDTGLVKFRNVLWYTNIEHGRRRQPLPLMTMADNIKFNKNLNRKPYQKYDNYDAIEVPNVNAIPSDYDGVMGVPVNFLENHCPEQFEILGSNRGINQEPTGIYGRGTFLNGREVFKRLFIRHKRS